MPVVDFSEDDLRILRDVVEAERRRSRTTVGRPDVPEQLAQAPEVYMARAGADGIPALDAGTAGTGTGTGTGTGGGHGLTDDSPGSAVCEIYRKVTRSDLAEVLTPLGFTREVFNYSTTAVEPYALVRVIRDKWGVWWCDPPSAAGVASTYPLPVIVTSTDSTIASPFTSLVISKPSQVNDDDYLVVVASTISGTGDITGPAGWTTLLVGAINTNRRYWIGYKKASGEGASWAWTLASADSGAGAKLMVVRNATSLSTGTSIDDTGTATNVLVPGNTVLPGSVYLVAAKTDASGGSFVPGDGGTALTYQGYEYTLKTQAIIWSRHMTGDGTGGTGRVRLGNMSAGTLRYALAVIGLQGSTDV